MTETFDIRAALAKAARIALVFMLVFYTSLRVELMVAYAADDLAGITAVSAPPSDDDELVDVLIYQSVNNADGSVAGWTAVGGTRATKSEGNGKVSLTTESCVADGGTHYFVAVPVWKSNKEASLQYYSDKATLVGVDSASFVSWEASGSGVSASVGGKNVYAVTPSAAGTATVKCTVDKSALGEAISEGMSGSAPITFGVEVTEPVPVVTAVGSSARTAPPCRPRASRLRQRTGRTRRRPTGSAPTSPSTADRRLPQAMLAASRTTR